MKFKISSKLQHLLLCDDYKLRSLYWEEKLKLHEKFNRIVGTYVTDINIKNKHKSNPEWNCQIQGDISWSILVTNNNNFSNIKFIVRYRWFPLYFCIFAAILSIPVRSQGKFQIIYVHINIYKKYLNIVKNILRKAKSKVSKDDHPFDHARYKSVRKILIQIHTFSLHADVLKDCDTSYL